MIGAVFLIFGIFGLAILLGSHYFLYRSFVGFFGVEKSSAKRLLLIIFLVLSISFILASVAAHFSQGGITRFFYIVTFSWLGISWNLLMAAVMIRLIIWLMNRAGHNTNVLAVAVIVFSLSLVFSVYGFWNAFHPQVKYVNVSIKNLPPQWRDKTVVQLSDVHLGYIHREAFLRDIVQKVNALNPDIVLITGDLFDGMDGDLAAFVKPLNDIQAKYGVFFVTGNHEVYLGLDKVFAVLQETKVKVLNNSMVDLDGLQIVGISYPSSGGDPGILGKADDTAAIIASLKNYDPQKPSILMHHAPTAIEQAKVAGINLQISGHTHEGQAWPVGLITRLIYGKYYYGLNTDGDFFVYTSGGVGTWGPPMRTGNAPEIVAFKLK